jgi:hypothetical protein
MTESASSDEADALYRPLGPIAPWLGPSQAAGGADAGRRTGGDPAWAAMVARGVLLAAAHESGALDGLHAGDRDLALSLAGGALSLAAVGETTRAHVLANFEALRLAAGATADDLASETWIRRVHEVACRSQLTHPVRGGNGIQDHVLAAGDYKHHPNHERTPAGRWVAHAPVSELRGEMERFIALARHAGFEALGPVGRAAYVHHALTHVAPFADGNGRVARASASGHLLRSTGVPLLVFADAAGSYARAMAEADAGDPGPLVSFIAQRRRAVVDLLADLQATVASSPLHAAALDRWRQHDRAGAALAAVLPAAVEGALDRHRRRADLGWLARLDEAVVTPSPVTVRVPGVDVDETLSLDAHPVLDDDTVVLRAVQAQLRLDVRPEELLPTLTAALRPRLDAWLDRSVSCLALRVAAELE